MNQYARALPDLLPLVEQGRTFRLEQPAFDLERALAHRGQVLRRHEQFVEPGVRRVGDRRPEDDPIDLRPVDRRQAHRARLGRRIERAAGRGRSS